MSLIKNQIKQVFDSYFDKQGELIRKLPSVFYKYDNCGNRIIEILFIHLSNVGVKYQYKLMDYDNKNNLKSKIVFNNFGI